MAHKWYNKPIISQDHIPDLERQAAINEFEHGLPRATAEAQAYRSYREKLHKEAAAYHLRGLRAAQAAGDLPEARKHGVAYSLHLSHLGLDPMDRVHPEIKELAEGEEKKPQYKFKAHKGDILLVGQ